MVLGNIAKAVAKQFSGLKVVEDDVKRAVIKLGYDSKRPSSWTEEQLKNFAHVLRSLTKPMVIAANKVDRPDGNKNYILLKETFPEVPVIPCSADSELALREAARSGLIEYIPGERDFKILKPLNEKQMLALDTIKKNILDVYAEGTGVQAVLNTAVFNLLKYIAVFPAGAHKLADSKGNILPDCFLVPQGTTALEFAFRVHTDLGNNFVRAIDARTKQVLGKEYKLKHRDGIEIVT